MSLLKRALGTLVELDETEQPAPAPASRVATKTHASGFVPQATAYDPEMLEPLNKVIAARKTAYTALLETANKLASVIPDENTRLKAAFATISGDGQRTLETVVQALDVHIADIERERMSFERASDAQLKSRAGALQSEAKRLNTAVTSADERIRDLSAEIARLTEQRRIDEQAAREAERQADAAAAEVNEVKGRFDRTADYLKSNLEARKAHLGAVLR